MYSFLFFVTGCSKPSVTTVGDVLVCTEANLDPFEMLDFSEMPATKGDFFNDFGIDPDTLSLFLTVEPFCRKYIEELDVHDVHRVYPGGFDKQVSFFFSFDSDGKLVSVTSLRSRVGP